MKKSVVIVGAGWAGISAAVYLTKKNYQVTLLEAAPSLGGRAREIKFNNLSIDNGQHLIINAYKELKKLLSIIDKNYHNNFTEHKLKVTIDNKKLILSFKDLLALSKFYIYIRFKNSFKLKSDALTFINKFNFSNYFIDNFFNPVCLATLSTPINIASAKMFATVIKTIYQSNNSNILIPKGSLSNVLPKPALNYLLKNNVKIYFGSRVKEIKVKGNTILSVNTRDKTLVADYFILATPIRETANLLPNISNQFAMVPIITAYLKFDFAKLDYPFIGSLSENIHWVFDRRFNDTPNILAVVLTGENKLLTENKAKYIAHIIKELKLLIPNLGNLQDYKIVCEKFGGFRADDFVRPNNFTSYDNLLLAGDYTNTLLPATLEGAVLSGKLCADLL